MNLKGSGQCLSQDVANKLHSYNSIVFFPAARTCHWIIQWQLDSSAERMWYVKWTTCILTANHGPTPPPLDHEQRAGDHGFKPNRCNIWSYVKVYLVSHLVAIHFELYAQSDSSAFALLLPIDFQFANEPSIWNFIKINPLVLGLQGAA